MKHTSGPWFWTASCYEGTMITASMGEQIAMWPPQGGTVEQCANARLIAAAPELAQILDRILRAHESGNNGAVTGEAKLCVQFVELARGVLKEAGIRS